MSTVIIQQRGHGCFAQILWFLFIGWWATGLWISVAWILCVLILPLPVGVMMLNRVPKVLALREPGGNLKISIITSDGKLVDIRKQRNFFVRAIYFILIGCWWSAIVIVLAYAASLTIIGLPLGFWLFDRVPGALTLYR
jgi:uncharacterized membrane protein YccF (DUF307 family)